MKGKLIVIKIGTGSLTKEDGSLDLSEMKRLVDDIARIIKQQNKVILVTSGAIASGIAELEVRPNPKDIILRQACAATGQSILMSYYREFFRCYGLKVAQVLLTENDLSNRISYIHTCNVLEKLIQLGIVPIINENDVTSVNEIMPVMKGVKINFSDNSILSALIANAVEADMVIILTTVDGLYTSNPEKPGSKFISVVEKITSDLKNFAEGKSRFGRGGMKATLEAAEITMRSGIPLVVANSRRPNVLLDILEGKCVGTYFKPDSKGLSGIKRWIGFGAGVKGQIHVNIGAKDAILKGASLLAVGIEAVSGQFQIGDVVSLVCPDGNEFARGVVNYSSDEINQIKGLNTSGINKVLGYIRQKEIVTRKRMHLIEGER